MQSTSQESCRSSDPCASYVEIFDRGLTESGYVQANIEMKDRALARLQAPEIRMKRYRLPDKLLAFLQSL